MLFNYFQPWQYILAASGLLFLSASILVFKNEKNLTLTLLLLLAGVVCLRWFAITLDPYLNLWDEQFHALVARNLIQHPLKPTLYEYPFYPYDYKLWYSNHIWLHKQPLFLWQMALSLKIFGFNEIGVRFPNFIMMTLVSLFVFRIGKLVSNSKTGLYAAIIFTTLNFSLQITSGRESSDHNDVAFLFYLTASLWAWIEYTYQNNKRSWKWIFLIGLFAGCAVLNKWITGLLVFGVWGATLFIFSENKFSLRKYFPLLVSLLVAIVVFLPWQIYCHFEFPLENVWEKTYNNRHFFEPLEGHFGDAWYHLNMISILYCAFVPYIIIPGFIFFVKGCKNKIMSLGLILAVVLIYAFFSIAKTKMPGFTFPVAGIMCLALGAFFVKIESVLTHASKWLYLLFVILFISFFYYNLDFQSIEKKHGTNNENPQKNSFQLSLAKDAAFFKQVGRTIDLKNKPIVFNIPLSLYSMFMFYTGATGYETKPSEEDVKKISVEGRKIYILTREIPDTGIEGNPSVKLIQYPENIELKREKVAFRFSNNKFLCHEPANDFSFIINRKTASDWETFTIIQYSDSSYAILSANNKFLSININGVCDLSFSALSSRVWEHLKIEKLPNGKITIKDCNNKYLYLKDDQFLCSGNDKQVKETEIELIHMP